MAASLDSREKLLTDIDGIVLMCAICMERFTAPKILPCYHTFCEDCLTKWVKTNDDQLICPTCKNEWPLPSGGVAAITSNRFLNDLLEVICGNVDVSPESISDTVCEGCKKEAKYWCGDCGGHFYCTVCIQTHRVVRVLKDHKPMEIEEYNEKMSTQNFRMTQPRFCDSHHSCKLEFYCDTCQLPICHKCMVVEHPTTNHETRSMESALEKYMPEMEGNSEEIAKKVNELKLRKEKAYNIRKDLDANRSTAESQINTLCQSLFDEIKNQQTKLLGEVHGIYERKCKQINAEIEVLEHKIASTESIYSYLNHLLTFGGAADVMTERKKMDQQLQCDDLANVPDCDIDSDLVFTESQDLLQMNLGTVEGSNLIKPDDWSKFTLKGQGPNTGQKFRNPCGLTFHDDQLLVCDKGNNIVQILNQDYKCESLLGSFSGQFAKPFKPQSVAVSQDDHFFMLDDNNLQILVCDQNNTVLGKFALPADTKPYCIALLKGFVLVTDIKGHRLLKYTKGGQYVTEIGSQGRGHTQFNYPYFVAVNSRDVIIVSDCNNHCIKCFDTEFNYLSQYGQLGRGDGKLFYIFSIAVDDDDNVYVCDSVNDRVAKWSNDGNWICNLFQGEVRHPEYIAVSQDRIYVRGAGDEHVTVFSK